MTARQDVAVATVRQDAAVRIARQHADATIVLRTCTLARTVRVVHEPADGDARTLASDVAVADSLVRKGIGLMGRSSVPEDYALVFPFDRVSKRGVHMVLVRTALDVVWVAGERVERVETLSAWTGRGRARADTLLELAPGGAADVAVGDRVAVEA